MPYLSAWQTEREFLLEESTGKEARQLQKFCLACPMGLNVLGELRITIEHRFGRLRACL